MSDKLDWAEREVAIACEKENETVEQIIKTDKEE